MGRVFVSSSQTAQSSPGILRRLAHRIGFGVWRADQQGVVELLGVGERRIQGDRHLVEDATLPDQVLDRRGLHVGDLVVHFTPSFASPESVSGGRTTPARSSAERVSSSILSGRAVG